MPLHIFRSVLARGAVQITEGIIAVIAEFIKLVGAHTLVELKQFPAVTTFDGDSLWVSKAIPPVVVCGHASASLAHNPVSYENKAKANRLEKFTFMYARTPRDFLKIATPWRWPRGSPVLQSVVIRILPMITRGGGWIGGSDFEVVMNIVWDTYVCWGLRAAFNDAHVHTIVPWFSRSTPMHPETVITAINYGEGGGRVGDIW